MRIVIDIMIGLMIVAVVAGGVVLYNREAEGERDVASVRVALQQLQEQAAYHTTVQSAVAGRDVLLVHLHREWFGADVPTNALLDGDRPWIDLAPPGDLGDHPPDPVAVDISQASFWYNPTTGVFRARVAPLSSEAQTLAVYNEVNGTAMPAFEVIPDVSRQPLAHTPGQTPAQQYAAMANKTWSEAPSEPAVPETDLIVEAIAEAKEASKSDTSQAINLGAAENNQIQNDQSSDPIAAETAFEAETQASKRPTLLDE